MGVFAAPAISQHQFRSQRRYAAKLKQDETISNLESHIHCLQSQLQSWESWYSRQVPPSEASATCHRLLNHLLLDDNLQTASNPPENDPPEPLIREIACQTDGAASQGADVKVYTAGEMQLVMTTWESKTKEIYDTGMQQAVRLESIVLDQKKQISTLENEISVKNSQMMQEIAQRDALIQCFREKLRGQRQPASIPSAADRHIATAEVAVQCLVPDEVAVASAQTQLPPPAVQDPFAFLEPSLCQACMSPVSCGSTLRAPICSSCSVAPRCRTSVSSDFCKVVPASTLSPFISAASLPALSAALDHYVDEHRHSKHVQRQHARVRLAFFLAVERLVPASLLEAARSVAPDVFHHREPRHAVEMEIQCHSLFDILVGVDFEGVLDSLWPGLAEAMI